jgi:hypothetical protein
MSRPTGDSAPTRGLYDIDGFLSPLDFLEVNHDTDSKEFADITVVDLTEDKPLAYDNLVSQYTILSSACSSVMGTGDDDDNKRLSGLASSKSCSPPEIETPPINTVDYNPAQMKPRKSGIRLRLNPPKPPTLKPPTPKILLRVEQPEQLSSRKCRGPIRKNDKRVRNLAPTAKKSRRKRTRS